MAKNILIIDDDKLISITLRRLLTREDYNVTTALSGRKALTLIENPDFDLIISDIKMPEKEDIYQRTLELNAVGYIEKPFNIKTLLQTTKEAIEKGAYYN